MNILLTILLVFAALIAIVLIAAFFVRRDYSMKRDIVIDKPNNEVFHYIKHLKNQDYFSKWVMTDPHMKKDFRGEDGTVGFVYAWDGNKQAGKGEQEIVEIREGERVDIEVRFIKPFESVARTPMTTEAISPNQTRVTWGMEGENKYPFNLMYVFLRNVLEKDLETSLTRLKHNLEEELLSKTSA